MAEERLAEDKRRQQGAWEARRDILREATSLDERAAHAVLIKLAELDSRAARERIQDEEPRHKRALQTRVELLREVDPGLRVPHTQKELCD